jgi:DNA mismatch endonuclease (patch repair protein)
VKLLIPLPSSESAKRRMANTRQRDTSAEMPIRRRLHAMGLRYRVDYPVLSKPQRRADIVFTRAKVAVFVDGCFWHGCPLHGTWPKQNAAFWREKIETNMQRDRDTDDRLAAIGWNVVRIWEHETPDDAARTIYHRVMYRSNPK